MVGTYAICCERFRGGDGRIIGREDGRRDGSYGVGRVRKVDDEEEEAASGNVCGVD